MVTVTSYGQGQFRLPLIGPMSTVSEILGQVDVETEGRRLAVNGHTAEMGTTVVEDDDISLVPHVVGG